MSRPLLEPLIAVSRVPLLVELCSVNKEPRSLVLPTFDLHLGTARIRDAVASQAFYVVVVVKRTRCLNEDKDGIEAREATLREIVRINSTLLHPNIAMQIGVYLVDGLPSIVRHYYHSNILEYTKSRPDVDKNNLLLQGCEGIRYLHNLNLYHGNISPNNMLVTAEGIIKVTDMLLSFVMRSITGWDPRDWRFRPPEEILNDAPPSAPGDIFALGTTIQRVMIGRPIGGYFIRELRRLDSQAPRTPNRPDEIGTALWQLIQKCRADAPMARPCIDAVISIYRVCLE